MSLHPCKVCGVNFYGHGRTLCCQKCGPKYESNRRRRYKKPNRETLLAAYRVVHDLETRGLEALLS